MSTSVEESDKNTGSNHEDDIEIIGVNARDESDKGSGTEVYILPCLGIMFLCS